MTGVNISYSYLTNAVATRVLQDQSYLGVYYCANVQRENQEMWQKAFTTCGGVDFFYSDIPIPAMQVRDRLQSVQARL